MDRSNIVFEFVGHGSSGDGFWFVMQVLFLIEERNLYNFN